jgi:4-hydroxy-3-methylbut-2-enyl diphosphate reductase
MKVLVAQKSGFCHGVENAISIAEKILSRERCVFCLGPIIHNKDMVRRLSEKGLKTVEKVEGIKGGVVLIRSHGASPKQIEKIKKKGLKIVDATCVLVKRVQEIAKKLEKDGFEVVIVGDRKHPEVGALTGCVKKAVVIADRKDVCKLPTNKKLGVVCQTTQSAEHFGRMVGEIAKIGFNEIRVINTLCRESLKRQDSAVELCKKVDVMFVLGGLDSANTRRLAELCKKYNNQTFHLQNWGEFDRRMVSGKKIAGVTAGASTPKWVIDQFVENLKAVKVKKSPR